jgi:drug/metabolite transporter (DMT)-like permease
MPRDRQIWGAFFGMGLLNNVIPFCLIVWGQTQIASGLAAILNATTRFFTVLLAHYLTSDEKLTANRVLGILVGLIGVVVIIGPEVLTDIGSDAFAQFAVLAAAVAYAFAGIYGRRFKSLGVTPLATATGQVTASTLMLLPIVLFVDQPWTIAMPGLLT